MVRHLSSVLVSNPLWITHIICWYIYIFHRPIFCCLTPHHLIILSSFVHSWTSLVAAVHCYMIIMSLHVSSLFFLPCCSPLSFPTLCFTTYSFFPLTFLSILTRLSSSMTGTRHLMPQSTTTLKLGQIRSTWHGRRTSFSQSASVTVNATPTWLYVTCLTWNRKFTFLWLWTPNQQPCYL